MTRVSGSIKSSELRNTINEILEEFGDDARKAVVKASEKTGKESAKELRKGGSYNDTGASGYTKGWGNTVQQTRGGVRVVVHNKKAPGLAHLLEFGHAKKGGGRTRAFPHIAPVNEKVEERWEKYFREEFGR